MAKKFVIPPLPDKLTNATPIDLDNPSHRGRLAQAMDQRGVFLIVDEVRKRFMPYVEKKLARIAEDVPGRVDSAGHYNTATEVGRVMADNIMFCYVTRKLGVLALMVADSDIDLANARQRKNDTGFILSQWLQDLSTIVGEKTAAAIFKRLETITNDNLQTTQTHAR